MQNRQKILDEISRIKESSKAYQDYYVEKCLKGMDEIGGHVRYEEEEKEDRICPSEQFMKEAFTRCAAALGINYEK